MLDAKQLIKKILLAFEQSSTSIQCDKLYEYEDGPNDIKQLTLSFGITEYGNLKTLVKSYCFKNGQYAKDLVPYVADIGTKSLVSDSHFKQLLVSAGQDPIMHQCQEEAYDSMYIDPAYAFCAKNQLSLNLSKLVICDSFLHSGSILMSLRRQFSAKMPINGGDEKMWVEMYCRTRRKWLANNTRRALRNTVYRMDFMLDRIEKGDWNLVQSPFIANDVKIIS